MERIPKLAVSEVLSGSFESRLNKALLQMGPQNLSKNYQHLWSPKEPTMGYCYVISELIHHLLPEAKPKSIPTTEGAHYFLELPDGTILDFAKDQEYNYSEAKGRGFLTKKMSRRARLLGELMQIL